MEASRCVISSGNRWGAILSPALCACSAMTRSSVNPPRGGPLACPPALCRAGADVVSPLLEVDAGRLRDIVRDVVSARARTELVDEDPAIGQLVFVHRSRIFGFPDTIWIQTVDLQPHASIIMYSRSNVGLWDLGVNRRRVRA